MKKRLPRGPCSTVPSRRNRHRPRLRASVLVWFLLAVFGLALRLVEAAWADPYTFRLQRLRRRGHRIKPSCRI